MDEEEYNKLKAEYEQIKNQEEEADLHGKRISRFLISRKAEVLTKIIKYELELK